MKATLLKPFASVSILITIPILATATVVTVTPSSTLNLTTTDGGRSARLTITNAGDQVWVVQSSSDLVNWTEVGAWKIHNGNYRLTFTNGPANPNLFYRAFYDAARQTISSVTTNALLLPASSYNYAAPVLPPSLFVQPILGQDNMPATNITGDLGATLGRVLFYDKRLSTNQTVSCSSCHQQAHGFSDPRQFSVGFDGSVGTRNSMGLSNARWYERRHFFWDERANVLEDQVLQPIQNPIEMGMTLEALTNRLATEPFYTNLFAVTFGSPAVTTTGISKALAQFVRSIISTKSKFDIGAASGFANFTAQENLGRQIFNGQVGNATCAACRGTDNFVPGAVINNNGLEFPFVDKGLGGITGLTADNGKFKVPSLRNIELTAPYMHDGRRR